MTLMMSESQKVDASSATMVREAVQEGGARAQQFKSGLVDGVHYLELVEPIKQLKREGRPEEALVLCCKAIEAAERGRDGREPAPWYTQQEAIVHRKLGQKDEEIAVLKRWLAACPKSRRAGSKIAERLAKLKAVGCRPVRWSQPIRTPGPFQRCSARTWAGSGYLGRRWPRRLACRRTTWPNASATSCRSMSTTSRSLPQR
jgi:hypothetical protein